MSRPAPAGQPAAHDPLPRTPFGVADELSCYYDAPAEPNNVHIEVRAAGHLQEQALAEAVSAALAAHPRARARLAPGSRWRRHYAWEYPQQPDVAPVCRATWADEHELARLRAQFLAESPPLQTSPPLRILLAVGPDEDCVILKAHHAALDGISCLDLLRSVAGHYRGQPEPEAHPPDATQDAQDTRAPRHAHAGRPQRTQEAGSAQPRTAPVRQARSALTPAAGGAVTPAAGGAVTPAAGGAVTPAAGGAVTPAAGGAMPTAGGARPPAGGGWRPGGLTRRLRLLWRPTARIAAQRTGRRAPGASRRRGWRSQPGYGVVMITWPGLPAAESRTQLRSTVNDILVSALVVAIGRWNAAHHRPPGAIRITVPISARTAGDDGATGNLSRLSTVTIRPDASAGLADLAAEVTRQTRQAKDHAGPQVSMLCRALAAAYCPAVLKRLLLRAALRLLGAQMCDTSLLSNLGNIADPPRFGPAAPASMWFSTSAHMPRGLSVGAITVAGRLHMCFRYRHALFDDAAAAQFAEAYLTALADFENIADRAGRQREESWR